MQLKSEFRNYESLRREHDSQIIQIAMEAGKHFSNKFFDIIYLFQRSSYITGTMVIIIVW
jgi:hypothetical protein